MDGGRDRKGIFTVNNTQPPPAGLVLPLFSLKGRTAIVSGAGGGIGLAVAHVLAEAGANVAIWYNSNKTAIDRAAEIEKKYGVRCKAYQVDVTDEAAVKSAVDANVREFNSRLDVFVANSGIGWTQGSATNGSVEHYKKVMATDLDSVFYSARAAGPHFRKQKKEGLENFRGGSFIATASMSGHIVNVPQFQTAYNSAKAGVIHMCKSLAVEWVRFARVNTISPGYFITEITADVANDIRDVWIGRIPMGREGLVHELAGAYLYLASDASSYATGTDIIIDGGYGLP